MNSYYYQQPVRRRIFTPPTPAVKILIILSAIVFILQTVASKIGGHGDIGWVTRYLALNPPLIKQGMIWQFFTYLFTHGSIFHLIFNMFVLYMFGNQLESKWGSREFVIYFFVTGVVAGLTAFIFMPFLTVGASGAIYGLLLAFGMTWPDRKILLYFLFPIKAKYLVILIGIAEFLFAVLASESGISHVAHLGGLVAGLIYLLLKKKIAQNKQYREKILDLENYLNNKKENKAVDQILDKIIQRGMGSLTRTEKQRLIDAGHYFRNHDNRV